ncbi:LOW QUALITY PROTEIN: hypothetical protein HID58_063039 [Brassica napus]|uniref:Glycosyltransferase n=1 Tax=Brassica napus TaxID=3708 RepID=A0ABQ8A3Y2_BRANA|nr:LOW QUALITY PROTEIN: hypothetical protein HID58_063039 [Brassica napus]
MPRNLVRFTSHPLTTANYWLNNNYQQRDDPKATGLTPDTVPVPGCRAWSSGKEATQIINQPPRASPPESDPDLDHKLRFRMASSSLGSSIPAPEAVQLLVSSLADDSSVVREASMASLRDIASLNPLLVLDVAMLCHVEEEGIDLTGLRESGGCCSVMAFSVGALEIGESDEAFMGKLAKIATAEIISSKELNADWQRQASGLLVSIGTHFPDLMMEELFLHLSGPASASPAMVQILLILPLLMFTPRLKDVLSRVLPILGNVRDVHRPIFANAFKCWSQAVWLYITDLTSDSPLDSDVIFELLLRVWTTSRDHKVRVSTVEALDGRSYHADTTEVSITKLIPAILELYKKDHDDALLATCSLYNLLNASLLSESGPPLLEFEDLTIVLSTLLPVISINSENKRHSGSSVGRKAYNEVQRCFLTVGLVYPEDLFTFLLNKCKLKEDHLTFGALCVLKHLLPRLLEAWHSKRPLLIEAARSLLDEQIDRGHGFTLLSGRSIWELFVEYLVRHSAIGEIDNLKAKGEPISPTQLRAVCGKGLLLLTVTIPEMEVCRCISELCRRRSSTTPMLIECKARADIPSPEELFTRLVVLLHNPLAKEQLATQILTVLNYLSPLFPKNISMFWQDENHWMSLTMLTGLYLLEMLLQNNTIFILRMRPCSTSTPKVNDRAYVRDKIDWMYEQADISIPANRLGLAKAMGLVAASHLDTVLEKLKVILDNVGKRSYLSSLRAIKQKTVMIHAALALMYGYAAKYAPSSVIEARIDALVGTNMLSRLLHVRQQTAKQAVITAIDLLGRAVINASESGATFPLKRRDMMLDYVLTLMGRDENEGFAESSLELLHTQALALNACTTLVSVEPKLTVETRNRVMKATLGFFALPNDPSDVIGPLIDNLVSLLCAILLTSGEDGRSRAEQLLHLLRQLDQYVSSPVDYQRKRGCMAVHEMLLKFRKLCVAGYCALGCSGDCPHRKYVDRTVFLFPDREVLCLGDRVITYLPRCADTNSEVRKISAQILDQFFSISLSLPKAALSSGLDSEKSYKALSSLEDVIAILKSDASIDPSEVFNRIVSSICALLTVDELVAALHSCTPAICDKIRQSAEGAIQAVTEFVSRRGSQLNDNDISRTTQSLLSAAVHITEKSLRVEAIGAISALAENTQSSIVFSEVLATAGKDIVTKDITRMRGGWPMQDAFYAFSQHTELSVSFMEHLISVLNRSSLVKADSHKDSHKGDNTSSSSETHVEDELLQAAIFALTAFFRGGGKTGKKAVEKSYSSVVGALTLQLGSCHGLASAGQQDPLRVLLTSFQAFCECVGDLEMGKILARSGEQREKEKWVDLIGDIAGCISIKRPKEVQHICIILTKALNRPQRFQREAAAAALSEFIRYSGDFSSVMEEMVEALCRHVSDDSPTVRRLCLRGLVQMPSACMNHYTTQVIGVILALLDDLDESVQLTAVSCLLMVTESASNDAVEPILLNLSVRLRNLQISMDPKMRANAFAAFGAACLCQRLPRKQGPVKHWPLNQFPCGIRGNKSDIGTRLCTICLPWKHICNLPLTQLKELVLGLNESHGPFIWVIRGREKNKELVEWILESRFAERIKDTGLLVKGLSPQMIRKRRWKINGLAHEVAEEGGSSHSNITSLLEDIMQQRGVTITIVTTPHNANRFKSVLNRAIQSGLPIHLVEVKFPSQESSSSEVHENIDLLDSLGASMPFFKSIIMLEEPVENLFKEIEPRPSCIIADMCLPFTNRIAKNFGIPKIIFHGMCCFNLLCMHIMRQHYEFLDTIESDKEYFTVPNFPDKAEFTKSQIPMITQGAGVWKEILDGIDDGDNTSYGVIVNTFEELEPAYVRDYKKVKEGRVWSIGPVSLCNKEGVDQAERGNKAAIDQEECVKWLDSKEEGSVLYICLGSICNLPLSQLKELGLGLEESQRPFIWVIRGWEKYAELLEWLSGSGFKERIKERGLLIRGWSPQMLILSHPAVGGFLTHCGWNSTLEGITSGVPLLTWPLFGDQFCNEKLAVQVLKVGVRAGVEDSMSWGEEEKIGVLVDKEGVKKAVEELMGDSDEAIERRARVKELGKLAHKARGVTITIVTTPQNEARFKNILSRAIQSGLPIRLEHVKITFQEVGLLEEHENVDSLDSMELIVPFFKAVNMVEEPVMKLMEEMKPKPTCLISDFCLPYTSKIAKKLNIPKIVFHGVSSFCLLCMHILHRNLEILEALKSDKERFLVPNFPDRVEFTKPQVEADDTSYGVIINTFQELESAYVKDYKEARAGKVWSIGPVSLCNKVGVDKAQRGKQAAIDQDECLKWLDSKEKRSVLYVCLGSICNVPLAQLKELGLGLEESQRPFIWVIRGWEKYNELAEWFLESGFEERNKERGLLIKGWSPQILILSHPAVGGFLTHCGWNSTLEGITSGVPLITWPLFGDQFCNQKLVVEVLKAGVSVGVEEVMRFGEEEKIGVLVDREGVKKAVEDLMGESEEGKERRKRVKELGELAHKAVEEEGSSHSNITCFLEDMVQVAQSKK